VGKRVETKRYKGRKYTDRALDFVGPTGLRNRPFASVIDTPLTLSLEPAPGLAVLLAVLYGAAGAALALVHLPAVILAPLLAVLSVLAARTVRREALGLGRGAPTGVVLRLDGAAEVTRAGFAPAQARLRACSMRLPGLAVLELSTPEGRVGVLITRRRVGGPGWRRLQVFARWAPGAASLRSAVNSPPPPGSLGP
jgi:hypothetical protein